MTDKKSFWILTISKLIESFDITSHQAKQVVTKSKISVAQIKRAAEIYSLLTPEMVSTISRSKRAGDQIRTFFSPMAIRAGGGVKRILLAVQNCQYILELLSQKKRNQEQKSSLKKVA